MLTHTTLCADILIVQSHKKRKKKSKITNRIWADQKDQAAFHIEFKFCSIMIQKCPKVFGGREKTKIFMIQNEFNGFKRKLSYDNREARCHQVLVLQCYNVFIAMR